MQISDGDDATTSRFQSPRRINSFFVFKDDSDASSSDNKSPVTTLSPTAILLHATEKVELRGIL